jgi:tRNA(adenine34) deaminase
MDEIFMKIAIKEAKKSSESIGCGTVIVKNGKIIAKAYNTQHETNNASAHAEINAIKKAGQKFRNRELKNCVVYSTTEPCIMCLSALSYAKIKKLVFGLSMKETFSTDRIIDFNIDTFLEKSPHKFDVVKGFMKDECKQLLRVHI